MPYLYNGKMLREGVAWTDDDGVQHPSSWSTGWTDSEKKQYGLVYVPSEIVNSYDSRYFYAKNQPRPLDDLDENGQPITDYKKQKVHTKGLKSNIIAEIRKKAANLLLPTDWLIVRSVEVPDCSVPDGILKYRSDVRKTSNILESNINMCTSIDDIKAFCESQNSNGSVKMDDLLSSWPDPSDFKYR